MNETLLQERAAEANRIVGETVVLLSIVRDADLQRSAKESLLQLLDRVSEWKRDAIQARSEGAANLMLGFESVCRSLIAELEMYLRLKSGEPDAAWDALVLAQIELANALRAHKSFHVLSKEAERLASIESVMFPGQVFLSAGLVVEMEVCTICGDDYRACEHLVGLPYWGEFCFRRLVGIKANHIAIVDEPANKRCRITHFSVSGGTRNRMTWRVEPSSDAEAPDSETTEKGLRASATIMTVDDLAA